MDNIVLKTIQSKISLLSFRDTCQTPHLLLAVSGGADSVAMLYAINTINNKLKYKVSVITVDHNIREKTETAGDAKFVDDFCKKLNQNIKCYSVELKKNEVYETAKIRKKGTEESARFLRYREFKKLAKKINADYILTAHNKSDYYETIVMRIFQGAEPNALTGIAEKREYFFRPMLTLPRSEIEKYLNLNNLEWREDSSNFDQIFLRNKIRHSLIPTLNTTFGGWQRGLDKTLEKINLQNKFISAEYNSKIKENTWKIKTYSNCIKLECPFSFFINLDKIFKIKFIQDGVNMLLRQDKNTRDRIPYSVFKDFLKISEHNKRIFSGKFCMEKGDKKLFFSMQKKKTTPHIFTQFIFWLEKEETIQIPAGIFCITKENNKFFINHKNEKSKKLGPFTLPCCIRSKILGDSIKITNDKTKSLKKIINEWKLTTEQREKLPIIEEKGIVKAVYGNIFGKNNLTKF